MDDQRRWDLVSSTQRFGRGKACIDCFSKLTDPRLLLGRAALGSFLGVFQEEKLSESIGKSAQPLGADLGAHPRWRGLITGGEGGQQGNG
jgi:hypothetical protein